MGFIKLIVSYLYAFIRNMKALVTKLNLTSTYPDMCQRGRQGGRTGRSEGAAWQQRRTALLLPPQIFRLWHMPDTYSKKPTISKHILETLGFKLAVMHSFLLSLFF